MRFGTVRAYCKPWYEVALEDGTVLKVRGRQLATVLIFAPADFRNPMLFHYDFNDLNPLLCPGWVLGLHDFLFEHNATLPREWLDHGPAAELASTTIEFDAFTSYRAAERADLREFHLTLTGTINDMRHPAIKALWWFASRRCSRPPTPNYVANYLTYLAKHMDNIGSVECARGMRRPTARDRYST